MRLALTEQEPTSSWPRRAIEPSDTAALGELMLAAYRGTADDEGESLEDAIGEVERTLAGEYGPFLPDASFVVEDGGRIVGARWSACGRSSRSSPTRSFIPR